MQDMRTILLSFLLVAAGAALADAQTAIQVYGAWHCSNDYCSWGTVRTVSAFDSANHWMIDRGDGQPSVNLVIFSFVNPEKLMKLTNNSETANGVPIGMTSAIVNYFTSAGVRVMFSIGGASYTVDWNQALSTNPTKLGLNAAAAAKQFGVGMEIDYENDSNPNLTGLQSFITAYRSQIPYDATGANPAARLTIDLGSGDTYLTALAAHATSKWLTTTDPVLDYANAMVSNTQYKSAAAAEAQWKQHVNGTSTSSPAAPPLAPAKLTGSVYLVGKKPIAECTNFSASLQDSTGSFVQTVAPHGAGATPGMLGYMFWAAECQGAGTVCTTPPNTCQGGVGAGATSYNIPIPMAPLRQN
jgi:hypothetical protein